jgi:hypothetical protein
VKRAIACILIAALGAACVPAGAFAESVFDVSRGGAPQFRLELAETGRAAGGVAPGAGAEAEETPRSPSPMRAATSSLLLSGLGEQRLGHTLRAKVFYGLEAAGWVSVAVFLLRGHSRESSYQEFAVAFAGVSGTGRSDDYYRTIGEYLASDGPGGYNEGVRRDARDLYYPDVDAMDAYYRAHAIPSADAWSWRSLGDYQRYAALRSGSRFAYRVALYSAVGLAALRVASAADAVRLARLDQRRPADAGRTSMGLDPADGGFTLFVQRSF